MLHVINQVAGKCHHYQIFMHQHFNCRHKKCRLCSFLTIVQNESLLLPLLNDAGILLLLNVVKESLMLLKLCLLMEASLTTPPIGGRE